MSFMVPLISEHEFPTVHVRLCDCFECIHRASYNFLTVLRSDCLSACSYCQINSCSSENEMCKICGTTDCLSRRKAATETEQKQKQQKAKQPTANNKGQQPTAGGRIGGGGLAPNLWPCSGQKPFLYGFHFLYAVRAVCFCVAC